MAAPSLSLKMTDAMVNALNQKAREEFAASHAYLAASFWFKQRDFDGISAYLLKDSASERDHGLKIFEYIIKRGGVSVALDVPQPDISSWRKAADVFKTLLATEVQVGTTLTTLANQAKEEGDAMTSAFLHEFLILQIDEIDEMSSLYAKVQAYDAMPGLLYHLDKEL